MPLRHVTARRYIMPLREGGSLPAVVEADDDGLYVLKFRGAGQGPKVLVAELVAGEIARALGLEVPEIVLMALDGDLARTEPDAEIQALIRASVGLNLALDYLPGAVTFDPVVQVPDAALASRIVWFDAFVANVDRTARNANLLVWHRAIRLIDHGAALYFHHDRDAAVAHSRDAFAHVKQHLLLGFAAQLREVDAQFAATLSAERLTAIVAMIPASWLDADTEAHRATYRDFLLQRVQSPRIFVEEALRARSLLV
jgi:hypothetical protein